ncbi:MAG: tRNA (adenosine(37)-N6)-threonylcarbamoyltransferase complex ATPase subunit type 1 TsaE [Alphaproteobacteria bacterium]|nr:tRNA (adenosine(37)-N6)-threonylcarbamoyltransferase complex ATPase subunit type 1 TsaE [Alphaproteobacteria bacterium]
MAFNKAFHVKNEAALAEVAAEIAANLPKGALLALEGDLGAGKTALARALIRHKTGKPQQDVPSPTFTLVQTYEAPDGEIWHFDLYRLKSPEEVYEIGWEDAQSAASLMVVEWPSRIGALIPFNAVKANIAINTDGTRTITVGSP